MKKYENFKTDWKKVRQSIASFMNYTENYRPDDVFDKREYASLCNIFLNSKRNSRKNFLWQYNLYTSTCFLALKKHNLSSIENLDL